MTALNMSHLIVVANTPGSFAVSSSQAIQPLSAGNRGVRVFRLGQWLCRTRRIVGSNICKIWAWAAIIIVGLNGVWPILAHAKRSDPLGEICSAHAQESTASNTESSGGPDRDEKLFHCALCAIVADRIPVHTCAASLFSASRSEAGFGTVTSLTEGRRFLLYPPEQPRAPPTVFVIYP